MARTKSDLPGRVKLETYVDPADEQVISALAKKEQSNKSVVLRRLIHEFAEKQRNEAAKIAGDG